MADLGVTALVRTEILVVWFESTLFGILSVLTAISIYTLAIGRSLKDINKVLIASCVLMWLLASAHLGTNIAFAIHILAGSGINLLYSLSVSRGFLVMANIFLVDCVTIYRLSKIWPQNRLVLIIPVCLALTILGIGASAASLMVGVPDPYVTNSAALQRSATIAGIVFTVNNVLITALSAYRIHSIRSLSTIHQMARSHTTLYKKAMTQIIESGVLLASATTIWIVFVMLGSSPTQQVLNEGLIQIFNIAPTLIIVRVGLGVAHDSQLSINGRNLAGAGTFSSHINITFHTHSQGENGPFDRRNPPNHRDDSNKHVTLDNDPHITEAKLLKGAGSICSSPVSPI